MQSIASNILDYALLATLRSVILANEKWTTNRSINLMSYSRVFQTLTKEKNSYEISENKVTCIDLRKKGVHANRKCLGSFLKLARISGFWRRERLLIGKYLIAIS